MWSRRTGQSGGAESSTAQGTSQTTQGNDEYNGSQWRTGEPLATATLARTLRRRSKQNRRMEQSTLVGVYKYV